MHYVTAFKKGIYLPLFLALAGALLFLQPALILAAGGDRDTGFTTGTGFDGTVTEIVRQQDGKLLVSGVFTTYNGANQGKLARLNPDGTLDNTFAPTINGQINAIALQADGKIVLGGQFTQVNATPITGVARLNPNGTVDTTFNVGAGTDAAAVADVSIAVDGKIYVAGAFSTISTTARVNLARLNITGTVDTGFTVGTSTGANPVRRVVPQSDGRVLIAGNFNSYQGSPVASGVARLEANGSLDATFNAPTDLSGAVINLVLDQSGRAVAVGAFAKGIVRLDNSGALDNTFNPATGVPLGTGALAVAIQSNGKIVVGGLFASFNGQTTGNLVRLNADGTNDATFPTNSGANSFVSALVVQPDGKVVAGGDFTSYGGVASGRIVRLLPEPGTLSFSANNFNVTEGATATITVNRTGGSDNAVSARISVTNQTAALGADFLRRDGQLDTGFTASGPFTGTVLAIARQADGKILVGGSFFRTGQNPNTTRDFLLRLEADGTLDPTFEFGPGNDVSFNNPVETIVIQPDGKILVGGSFTRVAGGGTDLYGRIVRLNPNGSVDTSFRPSVQFAAGATAGGNPLSINDIVLQPDGKILVGGNFTQFAGANRNRIVRLNEDGTIDPTFVPNNDVNAGANNNEVKVIAVQPDGRILIGGNFSRVSSPATDNRFRIARLTISGTLDTSFAPGGNIGDNTVEEIVVQPDGKILVGGSFTNAGPNGLTRLNLDGSFDSAFNGSLGVGFSSGVNAVELQPDGKILVGGIFRSVTTGAGTFIAPSIARINPTGSFDNTFNPGTGITGTIPFPGDPNVRQGIYAIDLLPDGKLLAGGVFTTYNTIARTGVVRVYGDLFVSWAAGDTAPKSVEIPTVDDALIEGSETFRVTLNNIVGLTISPLPTATVTILDNDAGITLTSAPNPSVYGQNVVFTATITPTLATGSVSFYDDGNLLGTSPVASGIATFTTNALTVGSHPITATYSGDTQYNAANSNTVNQVVTQANPVITITSAPNPSLDGETVFFTVTVTPTATGTITVTEGATVLFSGSLTDSKVNFSYVFTAGTHVITATYSGDANVAAGTSAQYTQTTTCSYVLTSATDNGSGTVCGTLSYALNQAASSNQPVTITLPANLNITGGLPTVTPTAAIVIQGGCTANAGQGTPQTVISSTSASIGITLTNNMTLKGVKMTGFSGYAVKMTGTNNTLSCSWIGTDDGTTAKPNGNGVWIGGSDNKLGVSGDSTSGVVVSGNTGVGVNVVGGVNNVANGLTVGYAGDRTTPLLNSGGGVRVLLGGQLKFGVGNRIS
jgi:uncharacterized delta-60 repeat protein